MSETINNKRDISLESEDNCFFSKRKTKCHPNIQAIAKAFTSSHSIKCIGNRKKRCWYICREGRWSIQSENEMLAILRDFYQELAKASDNGEAMQVLTPTILNDILRFASIDVGCEKMPRMDADVIPCANNIVLKWNHEQKRFIITDMSQELHITHTLTVPYDPTAKCDLFNKKICEIITDVEDRRVIQEYLGAALFSENRTRMILLLQGEGSSGKSVLVKLISGVLGSARTFDLDFDLLGKEFSLAGIEQDTTLLTASETASRALCGKGGAWAKKLVGGDEFQASQKFMNERVNHVGFYSVTMTSNEHLKLDFSSNGQEWRDRLLPIIFKHSIPLEKQDRQLVERLLTTEGAGILNWLLAGAKRVRSNNWIITLSPEQIAERDKLIDAGNDSIELFVKNFVEPDSTEDFTSEDAYEQYCHVAQGRNLEYFPEALFFKRLAKVIYKIFGKSPSNTIAGRRGKQVRGYSGLRLIIERH